LFHFPLDAKYYLKALAILIAPNVQPLHSVASALTIIFIKNIFFWEA
jgi:hypothetical protein